MNFLHSQKQSQTILITIHIYLNVSYTGKISIYLSNVTYIMLDIIELLYDEKTN